jgi:predicted TIM-barrel fold metal-dependent hydrolase
MIKTIKLILVSAAKFFFVFFLITNCGQQTMDFYKFKKIDAHIHVNTEKPTFIEIAKEYNFKLLTINTDVAEYPDITRQRALAIYQKQRFPGSIAFATTFKMEGWDEPDWQEKTIAYLKDSFKKGAIAVKVWKNIGMVFKDKDGNFVMIDDPKFDPIFDYLAKKGIPVVGHIGEPRNCWLPIDEMTVNNDKEYFKNHPQYHMYLHPEYPSYEDIINARDHALEKHPELKFIGCHLGSVEWSVEELGKRLKRFPTMAVDFAARMSHFQFQSHRNREKVINFFIEFQDQLIYGSDLNTDGTENPDELKAKMHETWLNDWKYLTTNDVMTVPEVNGEFQGLNLPRKVIEKIYRRNAEKWYSGIK